jgi:hypothetical protein
MDDPDEGQWPLAAVEAESDTGHPQTELEQALAQRDQALAQRDQALAQRDQALVQFGLSPLRRELFDVILALFSRFSTTQVVKVIYNMSLFV